MADERVADAWQAARDDAGVWSLVFDRPGSSQNSIDRAVLDQLDARLAAIEADPGATAVVIRSGKPRGFCAGADLRYLRACERPETVADLARRGFEVFGRLRALRTPTLALIHGVCLGGGLELAVACGRRAVVVGPLAASLGTPEVRLGLIPGWGAIGALPRLVGLVEAVRLLVGGEPIDPTTALRLHLVDAILMGNLESVSFAPLFFDGPREPLAWPPDAAEQLAAARSSIGDATTPTARARLRLLDCLETERQHGPDAGRAAAIAGLAELATTPEARAAIDAIIHRPRASGA